RSFLRFRRPMKQTLPDHPPAATVEELEGRVLLTFNAYIAGLGGGATFTDFTFVFSTTGQAAKHWDINWGDGSPIDPVDAPDPVNGWTSPMTRQHHYDLVGNYAVSGRATSVTGA